MCVRVCGRWSDQNILGARVAVILWGTGGNMRAGGYRRCGWGEIARVEMPDVQASVSQERLVERLK